MIRLAKPCVDERELSAMARVLESGQLTQGPRVAEFEKAVAEYVGAQQAVAVSSGTAALHLALAALGVVRGDEVLVADYTFPATANVAVHAGAVPVLVDIDLDTLTISPEDLERRITPRSKAVIVVDSFGCPADMDAVSEIARRHGIAVIEDAACAIGARYKGRRCGGLGHTACFSFHPRKVITTGEGGMITTDDAGVAEAARRLRSHGGVPAGFAYEYQDAGFNYRLSDLHAAVGVVQMSRLEDLLAARKRLAAALRRKLSGLDWLALPSEPAWAEHIYQSFVVLLPDRARRDFAVQRLRGEGIECTIGTYAVHAQPYYGRQFGYRPGDLPHSFSAFTRALSLPLHHALTDEEIDRISAGVTGLSSYW